ncbi:unnamed protein product, partial [Brachionus calyciflorus]
INECDLNIAVCPENSQCLNTLGSYLCNCINGFKSENNQCIPIEYQPKNEIISETKIQTKITCDSKPLKDHYIYCPFKNKCDINSDCIYDVYSRKYMCKCWSGYIGNGYKCYDSKIYFYSNNQICRKSGFNQEIICA